VASVMEVIPQILIRTLTGNTLLLMWPVSTFVSDSSCFGFSVRANKVHECGA